MFGFSSQQDYKRMDSYFKEFIDYMQLKQNQLNLSDPKGNSSADVILREWDKYALMMQDSVQEDMKVAGEIVLTLDKIEQGIFSYTVNSTTKNPMIRTVASTINKAINSLNVNMTELKETLNAYTNNDFRHKIDIDPRIKGEMLEIMQCVNALGDALSDNAKNSLENGQVLEDNSTTMNSSVNNLSEKANEQAASLEETAAAVEEITSNIENSVENIMSMSKLADNLNSSANTGAKLAKETGVGIVCSGHEAKNVRKIIGNFDCIKNEIVDTAASYYEEYKLKTNYKDLFQNLKLKYESHQRLVKRLNQKLEKIKRHTANES